MGRGRHVETARFGVESDEKTCQRPSPFLCYHVAMDGLVAFPGVDDRLVEPEITRDEIIGGQRIVASPARFSQARQHGLLQYVVQAHVRPGYTAAVHLLTRFDEASDFATSTCVLRKGVNPKTGTRYLEEIAFEVVS